MFRCGFPKDVSAADVVTGIARAAGRPATLTLLNEEEVWSGDADRWRVLLDEGASTSAVDADGLAPWEWTETKGSEPMEL